ncbi:MAG TPA: BON domain-containing protein [Nitrolancea sp.]|nr:BON domain-containing protein [Nitrolancea sp.]
MAEQHEHPPSEPEPMDITRVTRPTDVGLQLAVVHTLFTDPWVDASSIQISVRQGIVTLRGLVHEFDQRQRAEELVHRVDGVRGVQNILRVGRS